MYSRLENIFHEVLENAVGWWWDERDVRGTLTTLKRSMVAATCEHDNILQ